MSWGQDFNTFERAEWHKYCQCMPQYEIPSFSLFWVPNISLINYLLLFKSFSSTATDYELEFCKFHRDPNIILKQGKIEYIYKVKYLSSEVYLFSYDFEFKVCALLVWFGLLLVALIYFYFISFSVFALCCSSFQNMYLNFPLPLSSSEHFCQYIWTMYSNDSDGCARMFLHPRPGMKFTEL